ncbi:hypothetical protein VPNG_00062 [Vibrio phage VBP47]|uniref:Tail fiber protein n=1 Tax=Vibrio phage VBP47 TaxID=754073 RepID=M4SQN5_9CAUD|nr:hypothetical protein VPNG_00062 [Vibrio phage VBP47]AGH57086.1 hypothetical protein VPNG_00062 [Vibrio phage VBP47]
MGLKSTFSTNEGKAEACAVDKYVNTAYDNMVIISDNIEALLEISDNLEYLTVYLGSYTTDPTERPDGTPLQDGDYYFNTLINALVYYDLAETNWFTVDPQELLDARDAAQAAQAAAETAEANALVSENNAAASELNASNSEAAALASEQAAAISEANASASETAAALSETNAAASEANALASENAAKASETAAALSETNAATSETNAANSASAALTSETNAAASETSAANSAVVAGGYAADAEAAFDNFNDLYLGAKTADPTLDNDGNPLQVGATYWNSVTNDLRYWNGVSWDIPEETAIQAANTAVAARDDAQISETNAAASAAAASTSETNAATSEANALASEQAAALSETNAATSASNAATSEFNAAQSASDAAGSAASAAQSEANIDVAVTEAQNDIIGGSIFKGSNGEHVQNGDTVPSGTTHLRVEIGGEPTIVAMYPKSSGDVSSLSDDGATIGGTQVTFFKEIEKSVVYASNWIGLTTTNVTEKLIEMHKYAYENRLQVIYDGNFSLEVDLSKTSTSQGGTPIFVDSDTDFGGVTFSFKNASSVGGGDDDEFMRFDAQDLIDISGFVNISEFGYGSTYAPSLAAYEDAYIFINTTKDLVKRNPSDTEFRTYAVNNKVHRFGQLQYPVNYDCSDATGFKSAVLRPSKNAITIKGGIIDCTGVNNARLFVTARNNTTLDGIKCVRSDSPLNTSNNIFYFDRCCDITYKNMKPLGQNSSGTGTYGISGDGAVNLTLDNVSAVVGWGAMGTNYVNGLNVIGGYLSRVDVHFMGENIEVTRTQLKGLNIQVGIGGGYLKVKDVSVVLGKDPQRNIVDANRLIYIRPDYGSTWKGDIDIDGVSIRVAKEYDVVDTAFDMVQNVFSDNDTLVSPEIHYPFGMSLSAKNVSILVYPVGGFMGLELFNCGTVGPQQSRMMLPLKIEMESFKSITRNSEVPIVLSRTFSFIFDNDPQLHWAHTQSKSNYSGSDVEIFISDIDAIGTRPNGYISRDQQRNLLCFLSRSIDYDAHPNLPRFSVKGEKLSNLGFTWENQGDVDIDNSHIIGVWNNSNTTAIIKVTGSRCEVMKNPNGDNAYRRSFGICFENCIFIPSVGSLNDTLRTDNIVSASKCLVHKDVNLLTGAGMRTRQEMFDGFVDDPNGLVSLT